MRDPILIATENPESLGRNREQIIRTVEGVEVAKRWSPRMWTAWGPIMLTFDYGGDGTKRLRPEDCKALAERLRKSPYLLERLVCKELRRDVIERRKKSWKQAITNKAVVQWASDRLSDLSRNEACVDNWRVANIRISSQVRRYKKQQAHGCCGFYDGKEVCPVDGQTYLLGFNYGH